MAPAPIESTARDYWCFDCDGVGNHFGLEIEIMKSIYLLLYC